MIQWTYSAWKTFMTCPKQYKHKYVLKDVKDPGNAASVYGGEVHKAIENTFKKNAPFPAQYRQFAPTVEAVQRWPGEMKVEYRMALGFDLKPCDYWSKQYFVRGAVDLANVDGKLCRLLDWKTGKSAKYADPKQLELMSLMVFKHFPQVEVVKAGLVFLVPDVLVKETYEKANSKTMWMNWLYDIHRIEIATERDTFGPKPNGLCEKNCPVLQCEFNERR